MRIAVVCFLSLAAAVLTACGEPPSAQPSRSTLTIFNNQSPPVSPPSPVPTGLDLRPAQEIMADAELERILARTPMGRDRAGTGRRGAFLLHEPAACDAEVGARVIERSCRVLPPPTLLVSPDGGTRSTASAAAGQVRSTLAEALAELSGTGTESVANAHHVCVAMCDFGRAGSNAVAVHVGYVFVDPRIVFKYRGVPVDGVPLPLDEFVYLHEFAHMLQFWSGSDPFAGDVNVRRSELTADCTAGSLMTMINRDRPISSVFYGEGFVRAAASLGDYEPWREQHHGTPEERAAAVSAGVQLTRQNLATWSTTHGLTSRAILRTCEEAVVEFDRTRRRL